MTNRKAELEVSEAEMMLRQRHWICVREWADSRANDFVKGETVPTERTMLAMGRMEEELTALLRAVAASGSPPSPEEQEMLRRVKEVLGSDVVAWSITNQQTDKETINKLFRIVFP